jgi:LmbE family N-acetylglucosaminyl deacetylase
MPTPLSPLSVLPTLLALLLHPVAQPDAATLRSRLERLLETGRLLYVAAHPDDENTWLLTWAALERGYDAAYLSLTRGDGGQNLIGDEQSPLLGVVRTWELLAARSVDGARQLIGGEVDFGYSKTRDESLAIWGEEAALADVVWVLRTYRPHVVITRFPEEGTTHGHHLASAWLARRAFEAAGDPSRFPEQLGVPGPDGRPVAVWSPVRLLHNIPRWGLDEGTDTSAWLALDVGGYNPLLGRSYGEIAAESRSRHRSQGFGWASSRGPQIEYFALLAGPEVTTELFEGIDTAWTTLEGGEAVERHLRAALEAYDERAPQRAVPSLLAAYRALGEMPAPPVPQAEVAELVAACLGLFVDVRAAQPTAVPGGELEVTWTALLRAEPPPRSVETADRQGAAPAGGADVVVAGVELARQSLATGRETLAVHAPLEHTVTLSVPSDAPLSVPYWLAEPPGPGRYAAPPAELRGQPIAPPALVATVALEVAGQPLELLRPLRHVWTDPVLGERVRAVALVPPVTLTPLTDVTLVARDSALVALEIRGWADAEADVHLDVPPGWHVEPTSHRVSFSAGDSLRREFRVTAGEGASRVDVRPVARVGGSDWSTRIDVLDYPHLPVQPVLRPSVVTLQPIALHPPAGVVGYVPGPGDLVAGSLAAAGVRLRLLEASDLTAAGLAGLDAVLIGIRAFNTRPELHDRMEALLGWVAAGGTLVVQYQTNNRLAPLERPIGPYPLTIGRGRVTDEAAAVTRLRLDHPVWRAPNALTDADFEGWVQERGLYFAESWDAEHWTPLLAMSDAGEDALEGGLLVAEHGEGVVVYTGLSFFRQLPAGVPGAYRLLVNLLALGRAE